MSPPHSNEPLSSGGGSRQFWLFLLLIVLIVALVVSPVPSGTGFCPPKPW